MRKEERTTIFLAAFDISGIQDFIFATNRLKENTGASIIVTDILRNELPKALKKLEDKEAGYKVITDWENDNRSHNSPLDWIQEDIICAEIIYIGGGNAFVAYKDRDTYLKTRRNLAESLIKKCSYLTVSSSILEIPMIDFPEQRRILLKELALKKRGMLRNQNLSVFSIVEQDNTFGLPITDTEEWGENVTGTQKEKRLAFQKELINSRSIYQSTLQKEFSYATEMEHMASEPGTDSFVAVVHIDGNGMGEMIHKSIDGMATEFVEALTGMRKLSKEIATTYRDVFSELMNQYTQHITTDYTSESGEKIIPLRLVVLDGDDVTFICNASHGLPLAAAFIRELIKMTNGRYTACAGVCLAHNHFPFRIAYELAEDCCASAKESWYRNKARSAGFIDFQLIRGASERELSKIREEMFTQKDMKGIITRPYQIMEEINLKDKESFDCLYNQISKLPCKKDGKSGEWPRNRLKRLYESYLKEGSDLEVLKLEYASRGYHVDELAGGPDRSLFDALEIMDYFDKELYHKLFMFSEEIVEKEEGGSWV